MEICHVCPSRSFSGLEQYALEIALDQKRRGLDVGFVVCPGTALEKECYRAGITAIPFLYDSVLDQIRFTFTLPKLLKGVKTVHIHTTHDVTLLAPPLWLGRLLSFGHRSYKVILQVHIWINHRKKDPYHWLVYSNLDEVWCSSEPARKVLQDSFPVAPERFRIFNYGRDVKKMLKSFLARGEARQKLKLASDKIIIGTVSRIEEAKGIRELIEASRELKSEGVDFDLAIIGSASPNNSLAETYDATLREQTKGDSWIHWLGALPDSYQYLEAFDLYVLPSYEECFSLSLLDAQLAALPVVGTRSGGTPEIVRDGITGWLIDPRNATDLKEKLKIALQDREKWKTYGATAKTRVEAEFDKDQIFEAILKAYARGVS